MIDGIESGESRFERDVIRKVRLNYQSPTTRSPHADRGLRANVSSCVARPEKPSSTVQPEFDELAAAQIARTARRRRVERRSMWAGETRPRRRELVMYEESFGLDRRPFSATPDASCFIPLEAHQGVLDALAVSCERGQGIGVLTGERGLGKSLVGLRLAFELQPTFATAFLGHSAYATRRALLQSILFELNRPYDRKCEQELRLELASALKTIRLEKQGFVLIVDEAHRLSVPLLDEIRLLTLLADGGEPHARVVLIGHRELEERLTDPKLAEINQRISCQVDLAPLTQADSREYLRSSLEFAGARVEDVFTEEALTFMSKAADGVPRCLNHLADHSLLLAYVTERKPVSVDIVREALDDLKQLPLQWHDPITGGEVYRGLSQHPPMEDSAVDLWPQAVATPEVESQRSPSRTDSAFGESAAAIEIGGELDGAMTVPQETEADKDDRYTCLKEDWKSIAAPSPVVELLNDVTDLSQRLKEDRPSLPLGQSFASLQLEFGSPTLESFSVDEFADPSGNCGSALDDELPIADEESEPVWNLPEPTWLGHDQELDVEFEEEPVIDRYVRIEANVDGEKWARDRLQASRNRAPGKRTAIAVKTTRLEMASTDNVPDSTPLESVARCQSDSGIVESYSRRSRSVAPSTQGSVQDFEQGISDEHDLAKADSQDKPQRNWHLPTELLQATLEDDGIEEQLGANVLDMYLDVQQSLIDRQIVTDRRTNWPENANTAELSPGSTQSVSPSRTVDKSELGEQRQVGESGAIQRAYGRLFSELRRRKR